MGGRTVMAGGLAALALGGAWAATADTAPAPRKPAPGLARFGSCDAFLAHVRRHAAAEVSPYGLGAGGIAYRAVGGDGAAVAPAASPSAGAPVEGSGFSGTNLQEAGVDEPDLVKTDGRTIFSIANGELKAVDVTGATPRELPSADLGGFYGTGLILAGDRLLVLGDAGAGRPIPVDVIATPLAGRAVASDIVTPTAPWRPATVVVQLDVSDPAHPRVMARMRVDGTLVAARRTGGTVRVVLSSSPTRLPLVTASAPEGAATRAALRANRRAVARAGAGAWLPRLTLRDNATRTTIRRPAVGCRAVSRPTDYAGLGMIDVLTLGVTDTMSVLDSDAVISDGELVYASPDRMYVATTRWAEPVGGAEPPSRGTTLVHALDTSDPARTTYVASGTLRGYLPNAYAMSEKDGLLRAATTEDPPWWDPGTAERSESFVTVLGERAGRLAEVGRVGGLGRGERIESARFLGDRAYVVTFRRTDPLFAIDLSDPAHPVARGELRIPGFSSYLHPIDADTLIGVGQAADAHRKMFRFGAGHNRAGRHSFYRNFPLAAGPVQGLDDFVRFMRGAFQHVCHAFFGREDNGKVICPVLVLEKALQVLLSVRPEDAGFCRDRFRRRSFVFLLVGQGNGQGIDERLHHRLSAYNVLALKNISMVH